jgi:hypothetical protein
VAQSQRVETSGRFCLGLGADLGVARGVASLQRLLATVSSLKRMVGPEEPARHPGEEDWHA